MKILIISDSHDNIVRLRHVLGFAKSQNIDAVIHCGDWNTPLAISEVTKTGLKTYGVLGNADVDQKMEQILFELLEAFDPDFLALNLDGQKIGICHFPTGQALLRARESQEYDVLFYGHTHLKNIQKQGKTLIINPGALHKTLSPSFAVYDTKSGDIKIVGIQI